MHQKHLLNGKYLINPIKEDLSYQKMIFLGGPRQVGKTTLSMSFLSPATETNPAYLTWDSNEDRKTLLNQVIPSNKGLLVMDEIHKYTKWRNLLKGYYDKNKSHLNFFITGSARLDYYSKGGDALTGRYHYFRLHPTSLVEMSKKPTKSDVGHLLKFGGFPEPMLRGKEAFLKRWQNTRMRMIIDDDIRGLERVREISLMDLLIEHLPRCVGSPLSVKSLSDLLQVSHESVEKWISILERLYVVFRIPPFGSQKIRAVKKEQKLYFWDWTQVSDDGGFRFENMVASHLLRYCHYHEDVLGERMELRYIRDTDSREVDFVVIKNKKPLFAVECKTGETTLSKHIGYFRARTDIPKFFQVHMGNTDSGNENSVGRELHFADFCRIIGMI